MIAIKFKSGKVVRWKYPCENLLELRPDADGYKLYDWNGKNEDILYLIECDGILKIDEKRKALDKQKEDTIQKMNEIKTRLLELDKDINACMDGVIKVKTEQEYRSERIILRNELRVLEGKEPLKKENDNG